MRNIFLPLLDILILIFALPAAYIMKFYRFVGVAYLPITTSALKRIGIYPIRDHYYDPLFNDANLKLPMSAERFLPAIDLNVSGQLKFLENLVYGGELLSLKLELPSADATRFSLNNGNFGPADAEYIYQFIRAIKPRMIVEVGSGHSTKIVREALNKNASITGFTTNHICIEPFEMPWLELLRKRGDQIEIIRSRLEECDFNWSNLLSTGDLLFIDSSHVIRPQGDVLKEYLEILPVLASGVYIHIHDIFTPRD